MIPVGHSGRVSQIEFSPDGKYVVTRGEESVAMVWAVPSGRKIHELAGHTDFIVSVEFSPDGKSILTTSKDMTAKIWDALSGRLLRTFTFSTYNIIPARFSPDGKTIVTCSIDYTVTIWNVATGAALHILTGHTEFLFDAEFSHDGLKLVTASRDKTAIVWDTRSGKKLVVLQGHTGMLYGAAFSNDDLQIVSYSEDHTARTWNAITGEEVASFTHQKLVRSATINATQMYVLSVSQDETAVIWDPKSGNKIRLLCESTKGFWGGDFSPDGKLAVTWGLDSVKVCDVESGKMKYSVIGSSSAFSKDEKYFMVGHYGGRCEMYEVATGRKVVRLTSTAQSVGQPRYSPDGLRLITQADSSVLLWDLKSSTVVSELKHKGWVMTAEFSADGNFIITSSYDSTAKIWSAHSGMLIKSLEGARAKLYCAKFSPDGVHALIYSYKSEIMIWNVLTGIQIRTFVGHTNYLTSAEFSHDGKYVVSTANDSTAIVWDFATGNILQRLKHTYRFVKNARFSLDDKLVVSSSGIADAFIWDRQTGVQRSVLSGWEQVSSIEFSPDRKMVVLSTLNEAHIYELETGILIRKLSGHTMEVLHAEFSPDGKMIVTSSRDQTAKVWNASVGKVIYTLKGHVDIVWIARFSPSGESIVTTSADCSRKLWDAKTGKLKSTSITFEGGNYITLIANGYYRATIPGAQQLHYVTTDLKVISFEQLDVRYNRPDLVMKESGSTDTIMMKSYREVYNKRIRRAGLKAGSFQQGVDVPESTILNPPVYQQTQLKLNVHIRANDMRFALEYLNVWVNDSPLWGQFGIDLRNKRSQVIDTIIEITLSDGLNRITTSVTNANGTESYRSPVYVNYTPVERTPQKTYYIGIGVDHFANPKYNLTWSTKDIRDMCAAMKVKYGNNFVLVDTLFNENVTVENVQAIKAKLMKTNINDKVIIAYSGHGLLSDNYDYYLSTYDVNFHKPEEKGLAYEELENLVDGIPARQKLMLIDACHSGEVDKEEMLKIKQAKQDTSLHLVANGKGFETDPDTSNRKLGTQNSFELMSTLFVNVSRGTGTTVIAAASGTQFAYENGDLQNGVFTYCFLEMMRTQKTCTVQQMKTSVSTKVEKLTNGLQRPTSRTETSGYDWVLW